VAEHDSLTESRRFGRYLRKIREERKLSLDSVEEMTLGYRERITKSHLSRIENGQAVPTFPRMFALSQIYGVPISSLAEQFEIDLRRDLQPPDVNELDDGALLEESKSLRKSGRYLEALHYVDALLLRLLAHEGTYETSNPELSELRLERINCLVHLSRYGIAKEECEELLNLTVLESAEKELEDGTVPDETLAHLASHKGNFFTITGQSKRAFDEFRRAAGLFTDLSNTYEATRAKLNGCWAMIMLGQRKTARRQLVQIAQVAENHGYDRLLALAHSNLGYIAFMEDDLPGAEAFCLRSNSIARPREFINVVYRNCFYLWRIAQKRGNDAAVKTHERALRTYLGRVDDSLPEAKEYRSQLGGGES
jgi:transcriptional regulator with XRE-family HTH domain